MIPLGNGIRSGYFSHPQGLFTNHWNSKLKNIKATGWLPSASTDVERDHTSLTFSQLLEPELQIQFETTQKNKTKKNN